MPVLKLIATVIAMMAFTTAAVAAAGDHSQSAQTLDLQGIVRFQEGTRPEPGGWERPVTVKLFVLGGTTRSDVLNDTPLQVVETTTAFNRADRTARFTIPGVAPGLYNITIQSPGSLVIARRSFSVVDGSSPVDMGTLLSGNVNDDNQIDSVDLRIVAAAVLNRSTGGAYDPRADVDLNGENDLVDLSLTGINFRGTSPQEAPLNELATVSAHTPLDGGVNVGVTVRPQVFFTKPVVPFSVDTGNLYATFGGQRLPAAVVPANEGGFAWLFLQEPMPDSSRVKVTVDGSTILPLDGGPPVDADGDGRPGGDLTFGFTTVSVIPLPDTSLSGIIVDPGPDREPMTEDDFDPGPDNTPHTEDDIFMLPIDGVEVFLLGLEENVLVTTADGRFHFDTVPVGDVKLSIDGMTATSPPDGFYFPEMVMDVNVEAGTDNFAMAGMPQLYLPRLPTAILQEVTGDEGSMIVADAVSAPDLPADQRQFLTVEIQPDSLVSASGDKLASGQVGISTVPPELVMDMLPAGVLQHTLTQVDPIIRTAVRLK